MNYNEFTTNIRIAFRLAKQSNQYKAHGQSLEKDMEKTENALLSLTQKEIEELMERSVVKG